MKHTHFTRILAFTLAFSLCGLPEAIAQTAHSLPDAPSTTRLLAQNQEPAPAQTQQVAPAQNDQQQQPAQAPTQDQPRVVPVAPEAAPGTETDQAAQRADAVPQEEGTQPRVIPPPSAEELQQLKSAQQQNQPAEAPVTNGTPVGTAAAESAKTAGGGASRPAGVAIAPAKQKRSRSLLIKLGAALAAGAALGTVYGLSKSTKTTQQSVK